MIAIIGRRLRRLKIRILSESICWPVMSVVCDAVALERMEFEYSSDSMKLTDKELNELIAVRRSQRVFVCARLSDAAARFVFIPELSGMTDCAVTFDVKMSEKFENSTMF